MKKFKYKAITNQGKFVSGEVEAVSPEFAAKLVKRRGYIVINISQLKASITYPITRLRSRVSSGDITMMTRQLATMVNAGLPIVEALSILRVQSKSSLQTIFSQILADVEGGESFSASLKKHPKIFSPTYVALIKAGEAGGVLDKVLSRLADNLEKEQEFKGKVKSALIYPTIIVVGMIAVSALMVFFVIPKLTTLYEQFNATLPLSTRILLGGSNIVLKFWPVVLALAVLGFWGFSLYRKTKEGKRKLAEIEFKIPIIGDLQKEIILTDITRTLSLMVGAGVPILEGLAVTGDVIDNVIISDALGDVAKQIEKGYPIAFSFAKHPEAFPYILCQMVAVGEETGKMEEVLSKLSHVFEINSEQKVKALTSAIEPLIMIVLGIGVAFLVISVILPIYNLTTVI
jgi:type IV pilus assembly protein PilC